VAQRVTTARKPLRYLAGPSVDQHFKKIEEGLQEFMVEAFKDRFWHELRFILR
jgi:hypothetical protein